MKGRDLVPACSELRMLLRSSKWFLSRSSGCSSPYAARSSASRSETTIRIPRLSVWPPAGIGVGVGYVLGGVLGRLMTGGMGRATRSLRDVPAPELLAGMLLGSISFLVGVVVCIPLFVFVKQDFDFLIAAAVAWVLGTLGLRLGMTKGRQLADAARRDEASRPDAPGSRRRAATWWTPPRSWTGRFSSWGDSACSVPSYLIPEPVADEIATLGRRARSCCLAPGSAWPRGDRRAAEPRA